MSIDFRISEDQAALAEGVRQYLEGTFDSAALRRLDETGEACTPELWTGLVEMGLPGLLIPEAHGGMGLGLIEGVLVAIECGRAALPGPLVDTALIAGPIIARTDQPAETVARLAAGDVRFALAHPTNPWVDGLEGATHVLAADEADLVLFRADPDAKRVASVDPLRHLSLPPPVQGGQRVGAAGDLLELGALMTAAELVGLAERMLAMSVDYARERQQFGRPIGTFQAVKHQLADVAVKIEFARPLVYRAAAALDDDKRATCHVSHAKLKAADAAWSAAETAIQVHGAMGYTYEVDLHFWMKRSWALAGAWGDRAFHAERLSAMLLDGTLPVGPEATFN